MELELKGRHTNLGDDVRAYAAEKLGNIAKYNAAARRIEVVLDEDKRHGIRAEAIVHMGRGKPVVAHCDAPGAEAAIDRLHDLLERALRTKKEKVRDRKRGRHHPAAPADGFSGPMPSSGEEE